MARLSKQQKQAVAVSLSIQEQRDEEARKMAGQHPGFKRLQAKIAKRRNPRTGQPYGQERAGAILAHAARTASPEAKRRNPRLRRVSGA